MKQKVSNNTSNKEKDKNKIKENGKINVKEVQNKLGQTNEDVVIMSCNSSNNLNLPIIDLKFSDSCFAALLDTGANVRLIQPSALEKIKEQNKTKPYPIPKIAHDFAKQEIQKLLEAGIIEPSTSNYSFPIIFVKKNSDSKKLKFRMVVDYRLLNSVTESFKICLPKIADILHEISGKKWYSVLDLKSAFFQIKLKNSDKQKLAFCSELGNFQPTRLPFGSKNSTSYFHLLTSKCLDDLKGPNIQFFLDDIIIAANSISEMNTRLQLVFDRLAKFNLTLDPNKIQICKTNITYLGFNISANGYAPSEDNIQKVTKFPVPQNVKQVQSYLGMMNYFRHLIFNYAEVVEPIVKLTRKGTPFVWSENCKDAFNVM
ncbi:Retrovirus-related Pol polyprotein from transposon 412 [Araneus ventricosus]|uniref:RNA-directed DNA polymerase n=1 Tax=Araneus ventricosus TaxID=182803 RepID=A0A4Y2WXE3_ARAVE|nr:Retrovirus-related Pol polyprotein from transposon 412 [Araneus ventricosus]